MPSHSLRPGTSLLVEGPASIRIETGDCICLGAQLSTDDSVVVREERQIPIETQTGATLEVKLGQGATYREVQESTIPTSWREASQIAMQTLGPIAILGDVDSGKSTLCTFIANECFRQGLRVGVIDGDIGQADIGPPTTVSASHLGSQIFSLQDLGPESAIFVGDTSPSSVSQKLTHSLLRLKKEFAKGSDILLVNTDGWVKGDEALRYKLRLMDEIRPELVLGLSAENEIDPLLELQRTAVLKLNRSGYAKTRSREERKRAREFGYKRFLQNARPREIRVRDVRLRRLNSHLQLKLDDERSLRGVLAGLLDEQEILLSIGRVEGFRNGLIRVRAATEEVPRIIELGAVVLSPSYEEIGYES